MIFLQKFFIGVNEVIKVIQFKLIFFHSLFNLLLNACLTNDTNLIKIQKNFFDYFYYILVKKTKFFRLHNKNK